jgi:hypothetical protein
MYISTSENRGEYIAGKGWMRWSMTQRQAPAERAIQLHLIETQSDDNIQVKNNPEYDSIREVLALYIFKRQDYYCI